jgi:hypothetical protein
MQPIRGFLGACHGFVRRRGGGVPAVGRRILPLRPSGTDVLPRVIPRVNLRSASEPTGQAQTGALSEVAVAALQAVLGQGVGLVRSLGLLLFIAAEPPTAYG